MVEKFPTAEVLKFYNNCFRTVKPAAMTSKEWEKVFTPDDFPIPKASSKAIEALLSPLVDRFRTLDEFKSRETADDLLFIIRELSIPQQSNSFYIRKIVVPLHYLDTPIYIKSINNESNIIPVVARQYEEATGCIWSDGIYESTVATATIKYKKSITKRLLEYHWLLVVLKAISNQDNYNKKVAEAILELGTDKFNVSLELRKSQLLDFLEIATTYDHGKPFYPICNALLGCTVVQSPFWMEVFNYASNNFPDRFFTTQAFENVILGATEGERPIMEILENVQSIVFSSRCSKQFIFLHLFAQLFNRAKDAKHRFRDKVKVEILPIVLTSQNYCDQADEDEKDYNEMFNESLSTTFTSVFSELCYSETNWIDCIINCLYALLNASDVSPIYGELHHLHDKDKAIEFLYHFLDTCLHSTKSKAWQSMLEKDQGAIPRLIHLLYLSNYNHSVLHLLEQSMAYVVQKQMKVELSTEAITILAKNIDSIVSDLYSLLLLAFSSIIPHTIGSKLTLEQFPLVLNVIIRSKPSIALDIFHKFLYNSLAFSQSFHEGESKFPFLEKLTETLLAYVDDPQFDDIEPAALRLHQLFLFMKSDIKYSSIFHNEFISSKQSYCLNILGTKQPQSIKVVAIDILQQICKLSEDVVDQLTQRYCRTAITENHTSKVCILETSKQANETQLLILSPNSVAAQSSSITIEELNSAFNEVKTKIGKSSDKTFQVKNKNFTNTDFYPQFNANQPFHESEVPDSNGLVITETVRANIRSVLDTIDNPNYKLIEGDTGIGKTATIVEACHTIGMPLVRFNMSDRVTIKDFFGKIEIRSDAQGNVSFAFCEGPFTKAFRLGYWLLIDEANLAPSCVLQAIECALDTGSVTVTDDSNAAEREQIVSRHENFRLFVTQNPATGKFKGHRQPLQNSFVSRLQKLIFTQLPPNEWESVVAEKLLGHHLPVNVVEHLKTKLVQTHLQIFKILNQDTHNTLNTSLFTITIRELLKWTSGISYLFSRKEDPMKAMFYEGYSIYASRFPSIRSEIASKFHYEILNALGKSVMDQAEFECLSHTNGAEVSLTFKIGPYTYSSSSTKSEYCERVQSLKIAPNVLDGFWAVHQLIFSLVNNTAFIKEHGLQPVDADVFYVACAKYAATLHETGEVDPSNHEFYLTYINLYRSSAPRTAIANRLRTSVSGKTLEDMKQCYTSWPVSSPLILSPRITKALLSVIRAVFLFEPILLIGKVGSGKSKLISMVARLFNIKSNNFCLTPDTDPSELVGQIDPKTLQWRDGVLTQAIKSGEWITLDNLDETESIILERLNPLLEADPFWVLTEKGDISKIPITKASKFRFFATICPESLTGKKRENSISPALANRFSIVYLDDFEYQDKDMLELQQRAASTFPSFSPQIISKLFVDLLRTTNNTNEVLTLRNFSKLIDCAYELQIRNDSSISPEAVMYWSFKATIEQMVTNAELKKHLEENIVSALKISGDELKKKRNFLGKITDVEELANSNKYIIDSTRAASRYQFAETVALCVLCNQPILLEGPAASGKTAFIEVAAHYKRNGKLLRVNNTESTSLQDYFGSYVPVANSKGGDIPEFVFCPGALTLALKEGSWFLADELNLAESSILSSIAPILEGHKQINIPNTSLVVNVHPNFRFFATQNDAKTYAGRKELPKRLRNLFLEVQIGEIPGNELKHIIALRFTCDDTTATQLQQLYLKVNAAIASHKLSFGDLQVKITFREIVKIVNRYKRSTEKLSLGICADVFLSARLRQDSHKQVLREILREIFGDIEFPDLANISISVDYKEPGTITFFAVSGVPVPLLTIPASTRNCPILHEGRATKTFLKHFFEFVNAWHFAEPVLLMGPTSCKSAIVSAWQQITKSQLDVAYLTRETESADLIGQIRPFQTIDAANFLVYEQCDNIITRVLTLSKHNSDFKEKFESLMIAEDISQMRKELEDIRMLSRAQEPEGINAEGIDNVESELEAVIEEKQNALRLVENETLYNPEEDEIDIDIDNGPLSYSASDAEDTKSAISDGEDPFADPFTAPEEDTKPTESQDDDPFADYQTKDEDDPFAEYAELPQHKAREEDDDPFSEYQSKPALIPISETKSKSVSETEKGDDVDPFAEANESNLEEVDPFECDDPFAAYQAQYVQKETQKDKRNASNTQHRFSKLFEDQGLMHRIEKNLLKFHEFVVDNALRIMIQSLSVLRTQLQAAQLGEALFLYKDGKITTAAKLAQSILLENIELPPQAVVERLNSLLESERTFSLTEDITLQNNANLSNRIELLSSFCVFATAYVHSNTAKIPLSPAIRSRFTEIWVNPIPVSQQEQILRNFYLEKQTFSNQINAADISKFIFFVVECLSKQQTEVTVRDISQIVQFISSYTALSKSENPKMIVPVAALLAVKYIMLDRISSQIRALIVTSVKQSEYQCVKEHLHILTATYDAIQPPFYLKEQGGSQCISLTYIPIYCAIQPPNYQSNEDLQHAYQHGKRKVEIEGIQTFKPLQATNTMIENVGRVMAAIMAKFALLLEGPPGIGKTAIVTYLSNLMGYRDVCRINFSDSTTKEQLFGSFIPRVVDNKRTFEWTDGVVTTALRNGSWIIFDEINLGSPELLEEITHLLIAFAEKKPIPVPGCRDPIPIKDSTYLFATMNPASLGGGRSQLPRALDNHFTKVKLEEMSSQELAVIAVQLACRYNILRGAEKSSGGITPELFKQVFDIQVLLHEKVKKREIGTVGGPYEYNLRDLELFVAILAGNSQYYAQNARAANPQLHAVRTFAQLVYAKCLHSSSEQEIASQIIDDHLAYNRSDVSPLSISATSSYVTIGNVVLPLSSQLPDSPMTAFVHTQNGINNLQYLATATRSKRGILLEGPPCSAKTSLVKELAKLCGRKLVVISMNEDTEVADMMGQYAQISYEKSMEVLKMKLKFGVESALHNFIKYILPLDTIESSAIQRACTLSDKIPAFDSCVPEVVEESLELLDQCIHYTPEGKVYSIFKKNLQETYEEYERARSQSKGGLSFQFAEGEFVQAIRKGYWVLLDNINRAHGEVVERLNSLLEADSMITLTEKGSGEVLTRVNQTIHPEFQLFATGTSSKSDGYELSSAFKNRVCRIWLPALDADLSESNLTSHELYLICSELLSSIKGASVLLKPLLLTHIFAKYIVTMHRLEQEVIITARTIFQTIANIKHLAAMDSQSLSRLFMNSLFGYYVKIFPSPSLQQEMVHRINRLLQDNKDEKILTSNVKYSNLEYQIKVIEEVLEQIEMGMIGDLFLALAKESITIEIALDVFKHFIQPLLRIKKSKLSQHAIGWVGYTQGKNVDISTISKSIAAVITEDQAKLQNLVNSFESYLTDFTNSVSFTDAQKRFEKMKQWSSSFAYLDSFYHKWLSERPQLNPASASQKLLIHSKVMSSFLQKVEISINLCEELLSNERDQAAHSNDQTKEQKIALAVFKYQTQLNKGIEENREATWDSILNLDINCPNPFFFGHGLVLSFSASKYMASIKLPALFSISTNTSKRFISNPNELQRHYVALSALPTLKEFVKKAESVKNEPTAQKWKKWLEASSQSTKKPITNCMMELCQQKNILLNSVLQKLVPQLLDAEEGILAAVKRDKSLQDVLIEAKELFPATAQGQFLLQLLATSHSPFCMQLSKQFTIVSLSSKVAFESEYTKVLEKLISGQDGSSGGLSFHLVTGYSETYRNGLEFGVTAFVCTKYTPEGLAITTFSQSDIQHEEYRRKFSEVFRKIKVAWQENYCTLKVNIPCIKESLTGNLLLTSEHLLPALDNISLVCSDDVLPKHLVLDNESDFIMQENTDWIIEMMEGKQMPIIQNPVQ